MKKKSIVFLSLFLAIGAVSWTQAAEKEAIPKEKNGLPLLLEENFSQGCDRWEPTDKDAWKVVVENGNSIYSLFKQSHYEPPVRSPFNISLAKDIWVSDFVLDAKMKSTGRQYGHRDMCVIFGWRDVSHFYYVHIAPAPDTDPHANSIFLVNGEPRKSIAAKRNNGTEWRDNTYYSVRVERQVETGTIKVFFEDMKNPIMLAEDKTYSSGRIGVGSFDDTGDVDDILLWGKKVESPKKE
ncbi:MAG: hypothetical protein AB1656_14470 [Candidatus Omnitrophota bacterium]